MKLIKTTIFMTTALLCASHAHAAAAAIEPVPVQSMVIQNIADWEEFIGGYEENRTKNIILVDNLILTNAALHDIPNDRPFRGRFEGGGHRITVDRLQVGAGTFAGFFKEVDTPYAIKNFELDLGDFVDLLHLGPIGLIACVLRQGSLDNIARKGSLRAADQACVGGIVGHTFGGNIRDIRLLVDGVAPAVAPIAAAVAPAAPDDIIVLDDSDSDDEYPGA